MLSQSPNVQALQGAFAAHVTEHIAFQYRRELEKQLGVELPPIGEPLPEDVEKQLSALTAAAAERLLGKDQAEMQMQQIQERMEDPVIQMQQRELAIKEQDVQRKALEAQARIQADLQKARDRNELDAERIDAQERIAGAKIGAESAKQALEAEMEGEEISSRERIEGAKIGAEVAKELMKEDDE